MTTRRVQALVFASLAACVPGKPQGDGTSSDSTGETSGAPASGPVTSSTTELSTDPSTGSLPVDTCPRKFLDLDASGPECDVILQDCSCGQKCVPDGVNVRCAPSGDLQAGEPCVVDDERHDECVAGTTCIGQIYVVYPTCVPICDSQGVGCPEGLVCAGPDGVMPLGFGLCLPPCDPLAPNCGPDEECTVMFASSSLQPFVCLPAGGTGAMYSECDWPRDCAAGLVCVHETPEPCGEDVWSCCAEYCDLADGTCPDGLTCRPWDSSNGFDGESDIGACMDPA